MAVEENKYWPLDRTPAAETEAKQKPRLNESITTWGYTYTSLENYELEDDLLGIGLTNESSNVGMHTISWATKGVSGGGIYISYGFSDTLHPSNSVSDVFGGSGDIGLDRQEFDLTGFFPRKGSVGMHMGLRYSQTTISLIEDELKYHDVGMLLGVGGNHLLHRNFGLISIYWTGQVYGGIGWREFPDSYGYYGWYEDMFYYGEPGEYPIEWEEPNLTGGLSCTAGVQLHIWKYLTIGGGYKGQYIISSNGYGEIEQFYHGYTGSIMVRW